MHATAAMAEAATATFQLAWKAWSLTRAPPNTSML
jgi:hypothetical protein